MTPSIRRRVELDLPAEELWALVATPGGWRDWLVDEVTLDLFPGRTGSVRVDGETRTVAVRELIDGERLVFEWSPLGDEASSVVTIELDLAGDLPALQITETTARSGDGGTAARAWDVRIALLWVRATLGAPALA